MVQAISAINITNNISFNGLKPLSTKKAASEHTNLKETINNSEISSEIKEKTISAVKSTTKGIKKVANKVKSKVKEWFSVPEDVRTPEEIKKAQEEEEQAEMIAKLIILGIATIAAFSYFVLPWIVLFCKIKSMLK